MSSSGLSSLSSPPSSEDEAVEKSINRTVGLERYFKPVKAKSPTPEPPKREKSPPHEYVLADNDIIAFLVMFRSRFKDAFTKNVPHLGPQDIESGVAEGLPTEQIEKYLCYLLGLVLNRKKDVERGHYQRALEEAITAHSSQWPKEWESKNPLHGGRSFTTMSPDERLVLLRTLVLWSLSSSDTVSAILKDSYKQARHEDDLNQPLSVQPWGRDGYKRRYWLIEGNDDTSFRVYRESNPALKNNTWWSIAGSIDEVKALAVQLEQDPSRHARDLRERMLNAVPRFEATEEKRKRREYRVNRRAQFTRPEPGFSLYEGRTRGKRLKYTFSDDDDDDEDTSDALSTRRSTRRSGISTPAETGPTFTASGREVKSRQGGAYGESMLSGQRKTRSSPTDDASTGQALGSDVDSEGPISNGRPHRGSRLRQTQTQSNGWRKGSDHIEDYNSVDEMDDEEDAASSGEDYNGDDDEVQDFVGEDGEEEKEEMSEDSDDDEEISKEREELSLVVQLRYRKGDGGSATNSRTNSTYATVPEPVGATMPAIPPPTTVATAPGVENTIAAIPTPISVQDGTQDKSFISKPHALDAATLPQSPGIQPQPVVRNSPPLSHAHPEPVTHQAPFMNGFAHITHPIPPHSSMLHQPVKQVVADKPDQQSYSGFHNQNVRLSHNEQHAQNPNGSGTF